MTEHDRSQSEPTTLAKVPLAWWLTDAIDRRLTGTLVLEEPSGARHGVYLDAGAPRNCRTGSPVALLGDVLLELGVLSPEARDGAVERALGDGRLLGAELLDAGTVDRQTLGAALTEQFARKLSFLFALPGETRFGFFENQNHLERWGGSELVRLGPLALVWRGVREGVAASEVSDLVSSFGSRTFVVKRDAPLDDFRLEGPHRIVADVLRAGRARMPELVESGLASRDEVERVVYLLAVTHSLEFVSVDGVSTSRNPSVPATPTSLPPERAVRGSSAPATTALAELEQEIHERLARPQASHYELLGVDKTAPTQQIRVAFVELAKRFHPDRVGRGLPELSAASTRLFAKLLEAARVLSDPLQRARYDRGLEDGSIPVVSERPPGVTYDVTVALRRAESMLAHGNHRGAEREMTKALAEAPAHPEVIALSAWLEAHQPDADLRHLWAKVSAATDDASTVRVHLFRGQLLKRLGRHASALQEFRRVLELDPRHIDAAREVRIYERNRHQWLTEPPRPRSGTFPASASPGGFLGWLKRKS